MFIVFIVSIQLSRRCSLTSWFVVLRCAVFIVFNESIGINNANVIHEFIIFNIINDVFHGDIIGVTSQQIGTRML